MFGTDKKLYGVGSGVHTPKAMRRILCLLCASAFSSVFSCVPAFAATYQRLDDSAYVTGPKVNAESLKGKVVFFEYWGFQCGPCKASLPHVQALYAKYGARGRFVVVGSHVQAPKQAEIKNCVKDYGVTFPVYQWAAVQEAPVQRGIPYAVLIGTDGRVIKAGLPREVYPAVEAEMKKFSKGNPILPDFKASRYKSIADTLVYGGKNLEGKVAALARKSGDDEAKSLVSAFSQWKKGELQTLKKLLKDDPLAGAEFYEELKESLPESTKEFSETISEFRKDKAFGIITDVRKKTAQLEQKKSNGKKISKRDVSALQKKLTPVKEDSRESFKNAAKELDRRLAALGGK